MTAPRSLASVLLVLGAACGPEDDRSASSARIERAEGESAEAGPAPQVAPPDSGPLFMRVTGEDYRWLLRYPGPDGRLDTADDLTTRRHVHLPARRQIYIDLASSDYAYTFYVPFLDIKEYAVPEVPFEIDVETGGAGSHKLLGSQMCGYTHPELLGDVVIESDAEFASWLATIGG